MSREKTNPDFVESLARGLDVIKAFGYHRRAMSLTELAGEANLARATARRFLLTLEQLGYVKSTAAGFVLTPRVLELGVAYSLSARVWEAARLHLEELVAATQQASSIAQLDGADIIYVARVEVPKVVGVNIDVGTRYPARSTALGKVLLAFLSPDALERTYAVPSLSTVPAFRERPVEELADELREIRSRGWIATNSEMTSGVRSIAAPIREGNGEVFAAINLSVIATEVSHEQLITEYLPWLLIAAGEIGRDLALLREAPQAISS
ncbi:IclR family pca regulon transcriptional regulator [Amycolatopsis bartoniae]|uniref:Glycerol operon regulatory protein n=1 Tax=Amycolatopsis bartoniae TaxID=941986 RepID=A0A8H9MA99_9PSEU|nr:IclR family transcriptional regulator C-terminal domain-containing protein [Amycolatopsis bartoniae]MBB2940265.1 IclR family pca regulon transcriptional regulator [Amycolatopsis bartoniae]TVT10157.1 helix-turn-helix domain-containing protein [Amycolatopsis bartoniae]GHF35261.1 IclR family transcriptional regulator [Amycolatopsis bartoniae]